MTTSTQGSHIQTELRPLWVVGAGAVGLTLTTLVSTKRPLVLIARPRHRTQLAKGFFRVEGHRTVASVAQSIQIESIESLPSQRTPVDLWLAVKATDIDASLTEFRGILPPHSTVVAFSNGLGIYDQVRKGLQATIEVVRALPSFGVFKTSLTETRLAGALVCTLAGPGGVAAAIARTEATLAAIGADLTISSDVTVAEWRKAVVNLIVNPLCTLADAPNGVLAMDRRLRSILPHLLREIVAVARAEQVDLEPLGTTDDLIERLTPHASNVNSMLIDVRNGRATEVDYISGRFLEIARKHDVPTPLTRSLYESLKRIEQRCAL